MNDTKNHSSPSNPLQGPANLGTLMLLHLARSSPEAQAISTGRSVVCDLDTPRPGSFIYNIQHVPATIPLHAHHGYVPIFGPIISLSRSFTPGKIQRSRASFDLRAVARRLRVDCSAGPCTCRAGNIGGQIVYLFAWQPYQVRQALPCCVLCCTRVRPGDRVASGYFLPLFTRCSPMRVIPCSGRGNRSSGCKKGLEKVANEVCVRFLVCAILCF